VLGFPSSTPVFKRRSLFKKLLKYMKFETKREDLKDSTVKLEITIGKKEFASYRQKAIERLGSDVEVAGFRKGHAPKGKILEKLGEARIDSEALDMIVNDATFRALHQENLIPLESPKIAVKQFEKNKDLIFEIEVSVLPEIVMGEYKGMKTKKEKVKVQDEEVNNAVNDLRRRMATLALKEGQLAKGDWAEINFEGYLNGAKIDKLSSQNFPYVVGEIKFIPGFEDKIVGMKVNEEKEFTLKLDKSHPDPEFQNKEVKFKVKLNQLKTIELPKLDKEFAEKLGAKDMADLKDRTQKAIRAQKEIECNNKYKIDLVEKVAESIKMELPKVIVDQEKNRLLAEFTGQLARSGLTPEDYLKRIKKSKDEFDKDLDKQAQKNVKVGLTLSEVAKREKIKVEEAEVQAEVGRMINEGMQQGVKKSDLLKTYESDEGKRYIKNLIRNRKTIDRIGELNKN
jgi:trigger factor